MKHVRKAMGGGVESLFSNSRILENLDDKTKQLMQIHLISIHRVTPNADQPRKYFAQDALQELAESIKQHGILQPLVVKPSIHIAGAYTIIAGERRYRAAKQAGLKEIPVIIHEVELKEAFILALTENMQRESLNPLEEAQALYSLKEHFGFTQEELADTLGKHRSTIANLLRLVNLCESAKEALKNNAITLGHAKLLLGIVDKEQQKAFLDIVIEKSFSVRETEQALELYKAKRQEGMSTPRKKSMCSQYLQDVVNRMSERFATEVRIKGTEQKGSIVITFTSKEMLERLLTMLEQE